MDHLKQWLECEDPPGNYYQLLGEPCLSTDRESLLRAVRASTKFLHLYQNHKDQEIVQRARRLQLLCARAEHVFSQDEAWSNYDGELFFAIRDEFREKFATSELGRTTESLRNWLQVCCDVANERLDDVESFIRESSSHQADDESSSLPTTQFDSNEAPVAEGQQFRANSLGMRTGRTIAIRAKALLPVLSPPKLPAKIHSASSDQRRLSPTKQDGNQDEPRVVEGAFSNLPAKHPLSMNAIAWIGTGVLLFLSGILFIVFLAVDRPREPIVPQHGNNLPHTSGGRGAPRFEDASDSQGGRTGAFAKPKRPGHPFVTGYFCVAARVGVPQSLKEARGN